MVNEVRGGAVIGLLGALGVLACGDPDMSQFTGGTGAGAGSATGTTGTGGAGGATSTGTNTGGAGGATTGVGGSGGSGNAGPCGSPDGALLWSSLDTPESILQPASGSGDGAVFLTMPGNDFIISQIGNGLRLDDPNEFLRFQQVGDAGPNFSYDRGTIDFCFLPSYLPDDGLDHPFFGTSQFDGGGIRIRKAGMNNANSFQVSLRDGNGNFSGETNIAPPDIKFSPGVWVRVTVTWDLGVGDGQQNNHVYFDGVEAQYETTGIGPLSMPSESQNKHIYIGSWDMVGETAGGVIDEFKVFDEVVPP